MGKQRAILFTMIIYILIVLLMVLLFIVTQEGFVVVCSLFGIYGFFRFIPDLTKLLSVTAEQDAESDAKLAARVEARRKARNAKTIEKAACIARAGKHSK